MGLQVQEARQEAITAFRKKSKTVRKKLSGITVKGYIAKWKRHPTEDGKNIIMEEVNGIVQPCVVEDNAKEEFEVVLDDSTGLCHGEVLEDSSTMLRDGQAAAVFN